MSYTVGQAHISMSFHAALLLAAALGASRPAIAADISADITRPLHIGDRQIAGVVTPAPQTADEAADLVLEISVPRAKQSDGRRIVHRDRFKPAAGTGAFQRTVPALSLAATVRVVNPEGDELDSVDLPKTLAPPTLRGPLRDGMRVIDGHATPGAVVEVLEALAAADKTSASWVQSGRSTASAEGAFQITLNQPLVAGHIVRATAFAGDDPSDSTRQIVTDPGDWGRTRFYFAGGVVMSKEHEEFSQQDFTLAFALDKSWLQRGDVTLPVDEAIERDERSDTRADTASEHETSGVRPTRSRRRLMAAPFRALAPRQFNTFFDARMTALPVVVAETISAAPPGSAESAPPASELDRFIGSRKGAVVQIGAYAPIYWAASSWIHEGQINSLFIAPVGRFGIQTITESRTEATTAGTRASTETVLGDDVFHFWSAGIGIGHYRLSGTRNQAPELISYLHMTWGTSEAFELAETPGDDPKQFVRAFVEGRLKIPDTPMQIGFDANLGRGKDDLRFIFGTRFDLGALIGRLRPPR
jgi:hypothetical protein